MKYTPEQLRILSKAEKARIQKCVNSDTYPRGKSLKDFNKHELNALLLLSMEKPIELSRFMRMNLSEIESILMIRNISGSRWRKRRAGKGKSALQNRCLKKFKSG